jgi:hypothetical protein
MLDKRAQVLLKTLIERYIEEGEPVGSRTIAHSGNSPFARDDSQRCRIEMGFIASPHTSAGSRRRRAIASSSTRSRGQGQKSRETPDRRPAPSRQSAARDPAAHGFCRNLALSVS